MHKDVGRYVDYAANAVPAQNLAAGTSMLSTTAGQVASIVIDRLALPRMYRSCVLAVGVETVLPLGQTAGLTIKLQDNSATCSSGFTDYPTSSSGYQPSITFGSTSSTGLVTLESGIQPLSTSTPNPVGLTPTSSLAIDLGAARRYIQAVVVPSLSSSSSGYIAVGGLLLFGGAEELASTS